VSPGRTPPTFRTKRLVLRPFVESDVEGLHRILNQDGILRYFPGPDAAPIDRVRAFVVRQMTQWDEIGYAWWAVESAETGALLGWNGLQYLPETEETEIGFLLDRSQWGQGLTTEAARIGLRFGFEEAGLEEIVALAHPENAPSRRVIEKLGLRYIEEAEYFGITVCRYVLESAGYRATTEDGAPTAARTA